MKYVHIHIIISITYIPICFFLFFSLVFISVELGLTCILKNISTYEQFFNKAITGIYIQY